MLHIELPVRNQMVEETERDAIVSYVKNDLESTQDITYQKQQEGLLCYDFYNGRQWTDEEVAMHEIQRRTPFVFNEIKHKVDHLVGVQTQTRLDVKLVGREKADESGAHLLTYLLKWASQVNNLEYVETDVFKDGIIAKIGASIVRWENDDITFGYPKCEQIPYNEIYFDPNARKRDMSDARWMARVTKISRLSAKEMFPHHAEEIDKLNSTYWDQLASIRQAPTRRQIDINLGRYMGVNHSDKDLLDYIEYYERVKVDKFVIYDDISMNQQLFDTRAEALEYYYGLVEGYTDAGQPIVAEDGSYRVLFTTESKYQIMQTVIIDNFVANRIMTILPDFPFVLYFPYFNHGDYTSFVDVLISPQILTNRSFSQWDYILGTSHKNAITVMETLLRRNFTFEDLRREWAKTSPMIPVLNHQAINPIPPSQVNPQIFQNIEFAISRMNDYAGGRNSMGLQENAAESGRAVIARAEQGGVAKLPLFDGLRHWRLQVAERMAWYIQNFMNPRQIIRLIGDDKDVQYVHLDVNVFNTLKEAKYDIIVDEATKSETTKERNMQQLLQFAQLSQLPPEIATPMYLEYTALPETKKDEIRGMLEFYQQYIQQKAQLAQQQQMEASVQQSMQKQILRDTMKYGEEIAKSADAIKQQEKEVATKIQNLQKEKEKMAQEEQEAQMLQMLIAERNAQAEANKQIPLFD